MESSSMGTISHKETLRRLLLLQILLILPGCSTLPGMSSDEPIPAPPPIAPPEYVGDAVRMEGMSPVLVDNVGLVVNLNGTGSDPPPSSQRSDLLHEMNVHKANEPNKILASGNVAMVIVRGIIPAGARKDDRFDLEVISAPRTTTTSLRGGWLMDGILTEHISVGNEVHSGSKVARSGGHVLVDAAIRKDMDDPKLTQGVILGGGIVERDRPLGLQVRKEYVPTYCSPIVAEAINRRFHVYHRGSKQGAAEPKRDNYIQLLVHPQYYNNVVRYMRVIQSIPIPSKEKRIMERVETLRLQLQRPETAVQAAIRLEALGEDGIPVLKEALDSPNAEIRFYAAESLAYQDIRDAAEPLTEIARTQPAFRFRALMALGAMQKIAGQEGLISLLDEESAETRYGAFRVLRKTLPRHDPMISERILDADFHLHVVSSIASPLVHVATQERAEVVIFGDSVKIKTPLLAFAGRGISVRADRPGDVTIKRLSVEDQDDEVIKTTDEVANIIQGLSSVGADYPAIIDFLTEIKEDHSLTAKLEFSAIPDLNRTFDRVEDDGLEISPDDLAPYEDLETQERKGGEPPTSDAPMVSADAVEFEIASDSAGPDPVRSNREAKRSKSALPDERPLAVLEREEREAQKIAEQLNKQLDAILDE
jgi:flagellar basal body P-ring protein FlgI